MNDTATELTLRQAKIAELRDITLPAAEKKVSDLHEKLDALLIEEANAEKYDALSVGSVVNFVYGRGDKKRVETGTITAFGHDEKLGKLIAVQIGEGLDAAIVKAQLSAVTFEDVTPAEAVAE